MLICRGECDRTFKCQCWIYLLNVGRYLSIISRRLHFIRIACKFSVRSFFDESVQFEKSWKKSDTKNNFPMKSIKAEIFRTAFLILGENMFGLKNSWNGQLHQKIWFRRIWMENNQKPFPIGILFKCLPVSMQRLFFFHLYYVCCIVWDSLCISVWNAYFMSVSRSRINASKWLYFIFIFICTLKTGPACCASAI